ncbi:M23 family metallopeptidase [Rhodocaloribacter litoris]|uniref:M23 family metallopeptidase n=1 Tax=Rhodocaloribacter litoris TaxID=2558931 RepID=UPI001E540913|nr:M23 family metallopeptidase [Rhodocaloribacter litoris]QXD15772.1 M23 family metallopeptidase [Rhodocaloribacter litoris]GIV60273.1 MAG: peptidase M23 [Rhodothermaceae bacterium]
MRSICRLGLCCVVVLFAFKGHDDPFPRDVFRSPLGIPLLLSGNFAEMRSNHFHSGLDIKTNGQEGYRVYAAADGWVSRIVVSPVGYGHALYVNHPSGHTTVYAHLSRFNDTLAAYVKRLQYEKRSFRLDVHPPAGRFRVRQGEVIAYSGNSGGSSGPHLHFEIRDAATQEPLNPLLFGLPVEDTVPPRIYRIKVYALAPDGYARIEPADGSAPVEVTPERPAHVEVVGGGDAYRLQNVRHIRAHGRIAFGIQTHDYHNGSNNRLGAYRIRLEADGKTLFLSEMQRFSFDETRYVNAHVDYAERVRNRRWIQRSYRLPGNRLSIYRTGSTGHLDTAPGQTHRLAYTVEDAAGNTARLHFEVEGMAARPVAADTPATPDVLLRHDRTATLNRDGLRATFPAGTVYEEVPLTYRVRPPLRGAFSERHDVHDELTPVHNRYTLSLRADHLPARLRPKALIARLGENGRWVSEGGSYQDGYVTTRPRTFGTFFVAVDTLAPEVTPLNLYDGKDMRAERSIRFRIRDDLAGIGSYAGYVDDAWVLFAYDAKNDLIEYVFDEHVPPGAHTLSVVVTDNTGNTARYTARFTR